MAAYFFMFCLAAAGTEALKCWKGTIDGVLAHNMEEMDELQCDEKKCHKVSCPPPKQPHMIYCASTSSKIQNLSFTSITAYFIATWQERVQYLVACREEEEETEECWKLYTNV